MNEEYLRFEFKMGKDGYTSEPCLSEAVEAILRDKHPNLWEAMKLIGFEIACALNSENRCTIF